MNMTSELSVSNNASCSGDLFHKARPWEWSPFHQATTMMAIAAEQLGIKEEVDVNNKDVDVNNKENSMNVGNTVICHLERRLDHLNDKQRMIDFSAGENSRNLPEVDQAYLQNATNVKQEGDGDVTKPEKTTNQEKEHCTQDNGTETGSFQLNQEIEKGTLESEVTDTKQNGDTLDDKATEDYDDEEETDSAIEEENDDKAFVAIEMAHMQDENWNPSPGFSAAPDGPRKPPPQHCHRRRKAGRFAKHDPRMANLKNLKLREINSGERKATYQEVTETEKSSSQYREDLQDMDYDPTLEETDSDSSDEKYLSTPIVTSRFKKKKAQKPFDSDHNTCVSRKKSGPKKQPKKRTSSESS